MKLCLVELYFGKNIYMHALQGKCLYELVNVFSYMNTKLCRPTVAIIMATCQTEIQAVPWAWKPHKPQMV